MSDLLNANIIELLGLQNLPRERQLTILNKMMDLIQKRITLRMLNEMNEKEKKEAEKVFTSGTQEEQMNILNAKGNFQKLMEEEIVAVKKETVDLVGGLDI